MAIYIANALCVKHRIFANPSTNGIAHQIFYDKPSHGFPVPAGPTTPSLLSQSFPPLGTRGLLIHKLLMHGLDPIRLVHEKKCGDCIKFHEEHVAVVHHRARPSVCISVDRWYYNLVGFSPLSRSFFLHNVPTTI